MPTLYQLLLLPSTVTRDEIRAAYRHQRARITRGELPAELAQAIDLAYAVLDHPDRRLDYDLQLAAALRTPFRTALKRRVTAAARRVDAAFGATRRLRISEPLLGSLALRAGGLVALAGLVLVLGVHFHRGGVEQRVATPVGARAVEAPSLPTAPAEATPAAPPAPAAQATAEPNDTSPAPPPALAAAVSPARPRTVAAAARQPVSYLAPEESAPAPESAEAAPPPTTDSTDATVAEPASTPAPSRPALTTVTIVRTRPVTGERDVTMIVGRYCRDSSGGEVFTPVNAPADGLTC